VSSKREVNVVTGVMVVLALSVVVCAVFPVVEHFLDVAAIAIGGVLLLAMAALIVRDFL
jgi:hypothetical protein